MSRVCLDLNGVLADTTGAICSLLRREAGIIVPDRSYSKACVGTSFPNVIDGSGPKILTRAIYEQVKNHLFETDEFLYMLPIRGAVRAVNTLCTEHHDLVVVTDAKSVSRKRVLDWLDEHGFPKLDVVLTRKGRRSKSTYQKCCDVIIDNEINNLVPLIGRAAQLIHFLPPPGSAGCDIAMSSFDSNIPSLRGWDEVLDCVLETALAA